MGTMLRRYGLRSDERPIMMNMRAADAVAEVHRAYAAAGSDIIYANTFGADARALTGTGYTPRDVITEAVKIAKNAAPDVRAALDICPIGELVEPNGDVTEDEAYRLFAEQVIAGTDAGADLIVVETMYDLSELRIALRAARENSALPVFATMTFDKSGRTYMGASPAALAALADEMGIDAVGINCSLPPDESLPVFLELARHTSLPLIAKPNAGLPDADGNYAVAPEDFAAAMRPFIDAGAAYIGACCGSSPEFIGELRGLFQCH